MRSGVTFSLIASLCLVAALVLVACNRPTARADPFQKDVQASHVQENVPAHQDFKAFLTRDLTIFFEARGIDEPSIDFEPLRNGPTQSGVAYPKYYLWVSVTSGGQGAISGAARVAAIDRLRFEVTDFVTKDTIIEDPETVSDIFPEALLHAILLKAADQ